MLFVLVFAIPFSNVITSLGEEGAGMCASRAFVCLFVLYVSFFVFFRFSLGIGGWLQFVLWHFLDFSVNFLVVKEFQGPWFISDIGD